MASYRYLIVGGGMTAHAAAAGIRSVDRDGTIGLIGEDADPPYARPPLSKALWKGQALESIWLPAVPGLVAHAGRRAVALDLASRWVTDERGTAYGYERLLLATGGKPRRLPFGGDRVIYFRTVEDYRRLRAVQGKHVAVIGGGFIGSEVAAALAMNGKRVTMIFPEKAIGARAYPLDLAEFVNGYYQEKGVDVWSGESVTGIEPRGERTAVRVGSGREVVADAVVAGVGIAPSIELAQAAGIAVSDGIEVDERCQTSAQGVFAAGDVARFLSPGLGERVRVEHEDNALTMGRIAGQAMAGADVAYRHLPFFYSDLFDLGYEAVGHLDPRLEVIADWKEPFREGVVCYLHDGRVRGVLLWGIFGQVDAARQLILRRQPATWDEIVHAVPH